MISCKFCDYQLLDHEEKMMLDGNLPECPRCGIPFGEKPKKKE